MTPGDRVAQLYPRHWVPILVAFYDMYGLQWDSSLIPATARDCELSIIKTYILESWTTVVHLVQSPLAHKNYVVLKNIVTSCQLSKKYTV
jgi:hypothetical protein